MPKRITIAGHEIFFQIRATSIGVRIHKIGEEMPIVSTIMYQGGKDTTDAEKWAVAKLSDILSGKASTDPGEQEGNSNIHNIVSAITEPFDEIEIHPCKDYNKDGNIEQCEESEAEFWSVYVHNVEGGIYCVADCQTKEQARDLKTLILSLIKFYQP